MAEEFTPKQSNIEPNYFPIELEETSNIKTTAGGSQLNGGNFLSKNYSPRITGWKFGSDGSVDISQITTFIPNLSIKRHTCFESADRFWEVDFGVTGTHTYSYQGLKIETGTTAESGAVIQWYISGNGNYNKNLFTRSGIFTCSIETISGDDSGNCDSFFGIGDVDLGAGAVLDITTSGESCAGFRIKRVGGENMLYAVQSDGSTTTTSAALYRTLGVENAQTLEFVIKINSLATYIPDGWAGTTLLKSIDYYYRIDTGDWEKTSLNSSLPEAYSGNRCSFVVSNLDNAGENLAVLLLSASFEN